jgi:AraC family transcriptional regulator
MLLKIQKVIGYIHANLDQPLGLDRLAQVARLSHSRLYSLFKAETGIAPMRYVKRCRIEKARYLLLTTSLSIKEIRSAVGLLDRSHFTRGFKEAFGAGPLEYRRMASEEPEGDVEINRDNKKIIGHQ